MTLSDRDAFHDVSCHLPVTAIVQASGSGIAMASEELDICERDTLMEQVGDRADAEGVRRDSHQLDVLLPTVPQELPDGMVV